MVFPLSGKSSDSANPVIIIPAELAGVKLRNPTVLASGLLGFNAETLIRVAESGAGAVTMKSISPRERPGHKNPKVLVWEHGLANSFGLTSPGYKNLDEEWEGLKKCPVPVIASIANFPPGDAIGQFVEVAEGVARHRPAMIEINMSCPHSEGSGAAFGTEPDIAHKLVSAVKNAAGKVKVMPKLTANTHKFIEVAKACEDAGADAVSAINTLGPGMFIDTEIMKPVLSAKFGGISGPAIKPVALRCVYQLHTALEIPVLGMGGITTAQDAVEFILAGASAVGIGSGTYYKGFGIFSEVCKGMREWMKRKGFKSIGDFRGAAHEK